MPHLRPARSVASLLLVTSTLTACVGKDTAEDPAPRAQRLAFEVCAYCHTSSPGGIHKVGAIHAALRGKFVGILITDETTAAGLIEIKD